MLAERVIKVEILIVDELGDAVDLVLAIVHDHFWIGDRNNVYFATS